MTEPAVDIQGLTHCYGDRPALNAVSFAVESGSLFGLLGPNGSGKTTLFRILSTLLHPVSGTARVFGFDTVQQSGPVRRRLGVVFQNLALDEQLTVRENLRLHGALYGLEGSALEDRIETLLETFELRARTDDRVRTLSGGLQRRADLVRGLLHRPALLLLDEPTTGLDPLARRSFWEHLTRLQRNEGTTLLVATHLMEEAEACDAVGILDEGQLVTLGAPEVLKQELGGETLWLEADDPVALRDRIQAQFGIEVHQHGDALQISNPEAHALLSSLFEAFGAEIKSATVRRPTLEDVFMVHAGHHLQAEPTAPTHP